MDFASFIGIISGFALIVSAILMGGNLNTFINVPGIMIVLGGTLAATLLTFKFKDIFISFKAAVLVFAKDNASSQRVIDNMLEVTRIARRDGLMKIGEVETGIPFLDRTCVLMSEASEVDYIEDTLNTEIDSLMHRHLIIHDVFKKMSVYAPAFGMLGTLIGLIQMLSTLDNPETVGPAMAVALLTTFYGSLLASLCFGPIAAKLRARTMVEVNNLEIIMAGAKAIMNNNNYIAVYERLSSFIPRSARKKIRFKESS